MKVKVKMRVWVNDIHDSFYEKLHGVGIIIRY